MSTRRQQVTGWIALSISMTIAALWAMWGSIEAFHEGWWAPTLIGRLGQTAFYLLPMALVIAMGALSIAWHKAGAIVFFTLGAAFTVFIFGSRWPEIGWDVFLGYAPITLAVVGVGLLWWFGKPRPKRLAFGIMFGVPLLAAVCCGAYPAYRVSQRDTVVQLDACHVDSNGVNLLWAPAGPGWVRDAAHSVDWFEAQKICNRLDASGSELLDEPQGIWRLPTVEEAVRSQLRRGVSCGGSWDAQAERATYELPPDKEAPLWDSFSETTYWWTSSEADDERAYFIVYNGSVWTRRKTLAMGSHGFRAVRNP